VRETLVICGIEFEILLTRNDRIIGVDFLNRTCAFDAHFESYCPEIPPKSFFDSIGHFRPWPRTADDGSGSPESFVLDR
jgi:hypothetical protein